MPGEEKENGERGHMVQEMTKEIKDHFNRVDAAGESGAPEKPEPKPSESPKAED
ncbi:hypothetical protein GS399_20345 [Pedobacter sp. HMF7647]|uniref:Uncharacterized protein n=1 Tax=Hufsiella arboris TaxID=2695275 RepID=A0A7K1YFI1_9SPHI|nr:hypothetical protein [Hufsiella arboris]MXV53322.1 hypothetical protein [Hufsiella arboris]